MSSRQNILTKIKISVDATMKEALKKIDKTGMAILFVCDDNGSLLGSLSDGDIRKRIIKIGHLQDKIDKCFNRNPIYVFEGNYSVDDIRRLMLEKTIDVIPVVNNKRKIVDILFWTDIFEEESIASQKIDIPVIIMAGGKGERLGPFTKIIPKPLIPVGEKPMIEIIMDKFNKYGVKLFYITLNYKGEMIRTYFKSVKKKYKIDYIWEKEFLGTAGSLKLAPSLLGNVFIVSNCDIIVDTDYGDLLSFHKEHGNILSVVGSIQHHKIPYGMIHFEKEGKIKKIQEKPEFDLTVNTGLYVLSKKALSYIPPKKNFDMTDLLQVLLDKKESVGVYPVSQNSYIDIGQREDLNTAIEKLKFLK